LRAAIAAEGKSGASQLDLERQVHADRLANGWKIGVEGEDVDGFKVDFFVYVYRHVYVYACMCVYI